MLVVGVLRERWAMWSFNDCLNEMIQHLGKNRIPHAMTGQRAVNVHKGRNKVIERALSLPEMDALFFIDSDEVFVPETALHLYNLDLPIVSGLVFMKMEPHPPCIYRRLPDGVNNMALAPELQEWFKESNITPDMVGNPVILDLPEEIGVREVDECGSGAMMIKREVLEAIEPPWFECIGDIGSDLVFCRKAREAGFPVFVDWRCMLGHITSYAVTAADFMRIDQWVCVEDKIRD